MTLTAKDLRDYDLDHYHAGNGWAMVEDIDPEYCRIVSIGSIGSSARTPQAFLAWKKKLAVFTRREDPTNKDSPMVKVKIPEKVMEELTALREGVKNGTIKIDQTHFVYGQAQKPG